MKNNIKKNYIFLPIINNNTIKIPKNIKIKDDIFNYNLNNNNTFIKFITDLNNK